MERRARRTRPDYDVELMSPWLIDADRRTGLCSIGPYRGAASWGDSGLEL
jgi:hypothetical protein